MSPWHSEKQVCKLSSLFINSNDTHLVSRLKLCPFLALTKRRTMLIFHHLSLHSLKHMTGGSANGEPYLLFGFLLHSLPCLFFISLFYNQLGLSSSKLTGSKTTREIQKGPGTQLYKPMSFQITKKGRETLGSDTSTNISISLCPQKSVRSVQQWMRTVGE